MCGIFGYFGHTVPKNVNKCFDAIKHRGPDNSDLVELERAVIGFHRLAIIDPQDTIGVFNENGTYFTCNGEIYNYKFLIEKYSLTPKTGSDCEVVLQLYLKFGGLTPELINELDGVFAFIVYDSNTDTVTAARDRIGVRPMYYAGNDHGMCISSEYKGNVYDSAVQVPPGTILTLRPHTDLCESVQFTRDYTYNRLDYKDAMDCVQLYFTRAVEKR